MRERIILKRKVKGNLRRSVQEKMLNAIFYFRYADLPATFVEGFHEKDVVSMMPYRRMGDRTLSIVGLGCSSFSDIFGEDVR